jgi:uncharacterized protein
MGSSFIFMAIQEVSKAGASMQEIFTGSGMMCCWLIIVALEKARANEVKKPCSMICSLYMMKFPEDHIIVYGRSMGSGFASKLASDNHPRYLILDAPYYSFRKVVERFLPFLPMRLVLRYHLRTDKWISNVKCHTYIIHGTKDWLIPLRHSERLQQINPRRITLIRIEGGGHNNLPSFHEYHNFIRDILKI